MTYRPVGLMLLLLPFLLACPRPPGPNPVEPDDTDACAAACARLRDLGCEEGQPLEDGTPCEQFCVETQQSGHALNPSCVQSISSCEEIDNCD